LRSLGVRSTAGAARFTGDEIDFARIAAEAHVDLVMTGTLLRAGDAIRVTTQLVGARAVKCLWSHAAHADTARCLSAAGRSRPAHRLVTVAPTDRLVSSNC
jgi:TolB-like protein